MFSTLNRILILAAAALLATGFDTSNSCKPFT